MQGFVQVADSDHRVKIFHSVSLPSIPSIIKRQFECILVRARIAASRSIATGYRHLDGINALTIDLDDTLWELMPVILAAEKRLAEWLAGHFPAIPATFTRDDAMQLRLAIEQEYPDRRHDLRFLRKAVMQRMANACGYDDSVAEQAYEVFDAARNEVRFYPDVMPALEILHQHYPLVAVTNGNADLGKIGVAHLFQAVVTAVDAGAPKPKQAIFKLASERAGVAAHNILHIGDDPGMDVEGARNAGFRTAWMNRGGKRWPSGLDAPDIVFRSMRDVPALLLAEGF